MYHSAIFTVWIYVWHVILLTACCQLSSSFFNCKKHLQYFLCQIEFLWTICIKSGIAVVKVGKLNLDMWCTKWEVYKMQNVGCSGLPAVSASSTTHLHICSVPPVDICCLAPSYSHAGTWRGREECSPYFGLSTKSCGRAGNSQNRTTLNLMANGNLSFFDSRGSDRMTIKREFVLRGLHSISHINNFSLSGPNLKEH